MPENRINRDAEGRWCLHTEIVIDAPPADVWEVMTDFTSMPHWASTALQSIDPFVAERPVRVNFHLGRVPMNSDRTLTIVEDTSFEWSGPYMAGFADHHVYAIEPTNDGKGTRLVQTDLADGPIGKPLGRIIMTIDQRAYARWNADLKAEVERRYPPIDQHDDAE